LADGVNDVLRERGRALVVISEGFDVGVIGERKDAFGPHHVLVQPDDGRANRGELI